jgi:hypothetical protein
LQVKRGALLSEDEDEDDKPVRPAPKKRLRVDDEELDPSIQAMMDVDDGEILLFLSGSLKV